MKLNISSEGSVIGSVLVVVFYAIAMLFFPLMYLEGKIRKILLQED
jgi:hypothetical protein